MVSRSLQHLHIRYVFWVLLFNFKCKNRVGPKYLSDLLVCHESGHSLISEACGLLRVPFTIIQVTYGDRTCSKAGTLHYHDILKELQDVAICQTTLDTGHYLKIIDLQMWLQHSNNMRNMWLATIVLYHWQVSVAKSWVTSLISQLKDHFELHKILYDLQYEFCRSR